MTTTSYISYRISKHGNAYAEFTAYTEAEGDIYLRTEDVDILLALAPVTAANYSRNIFHRTNGAVADITTTRFRVDITYTRNAGGFANIVSAAIHTAPKSAAFQSLQALPPTKRDAKAEPAEAATDDDASLG